MDESPAIIRLNIAHYERLLETPLNDAERAQVIRLLSEARSELDRMSRNPGRHADR